MNYQIGNPGPTPKKSKLPDNAVFGFIIGMLFPLLGILLLFFFWGDGNFGKYMGNLVNFDSPLAMRTSSKVVSLSMFAMLIPFNFFLNKKKYYSTRGIILATAVYAILIIFYNFVWQ